MRPIPQEAEPTELRLAVLLLRGHPISPFGICLPTPRA